MCGSEQDRLIRSPTGRKSQNVKVNSGTQGVLLNLISGNKLTL